MAHQQPLVDKWLLFILGLGALPSVKLVGYITATEGLLLIIAPIVIVQRASLISRSLLRNFLLFLLLWLFSAIGSDLYREVEFAQFSRGWARVVMLGSAMVTFYLLLRGNPRAYCYFLFGLLLSTIVVTFGWRVGLADYESISGQNWENSWETTYVYTTLYLAAFAGALCWSKCPKTTAAFIAAIGCVNVAMGSRAIGGVLIVSVGTALFLRFRSPARGGRGASLTWSRTLLLGLCMCLASFFVLLTYSGLASRGYLGEKARTKYDSQALSRFGVVLGARSNVVGAVLAVIDSPIIGFGSWAEDRNGYFYRAVELVGFDPNQVPIDDALLANRIPTHSYLLEAWVEHGLLAAFFWFYTLWFLVDLVRRAPLFDPSLLAVACIHLWLFLWNIFFSPMGGRPVVGAAMALMIVLYDQSCSKERTQSNTRSRI